MDIDSTHFIDLMLDLLCVFDGEGRFVAASPAWAKTLGYQQDELTGRHYKDFIHPEDLAETREIIESIRASGTLNGFSIRCFAKDGTQRWLAWRGAYCHETGLFHGIARDITSTREAQKRFQEVIERVAPFTGQAFYEVLVQTLAAQFRCPLVIIGATDPNGRIHSKAAAVDGRLDQFSYDPSHGPCADVLQGRFKHIPSRLPDLYPDEPLLREQGYQAASGCPVKGRDGRTVGLLVLLHKEPVPAATSAEWLLNALAVRVAAEFEREEEQRLLQESESRYRLLTENSSDLITRHALDSTYLFASKASTRITGYEPHELLGHQPHEFFFEEDLPKLNQFHDRVIQDPDTYHTFAFRIRRKDGAVAWMESSAHVLRDPKSGEPKEIVCTSRDITERICAEQALRESQQRHALHIQQTPMGVLEFDTEGRIVEWNPAATHLFGWTREQALGRHYSVLVSADQRRRFDHIWRLLSERRGGHRDVSENITRNGDVLLCEWSNTALIDANGRFMGVASIVRDLTEQRRQEQLIEDQRLKIITSSKMSSLGEMAAGIAHEVNNPLSIICGRAQQIEQLAARGTDQLERITEYAQNINRTGHRIARIVNGLRFFARDGERDPFEKRPISSLIEDTLEFCRSRFHHHEIDLRVLPIPDDLSVHCRYIQISQVLLNILNNAFDAVENLSERWVRIEATDLGDWVSIYITDSGSGISPSIASRMMNPFFTTKELGRGTGLGLSIAQGIVESHGGRFLYQSECPNTQFQILLPKDRSRADQKVLTYVRSEAQRV